MKKTLHSWMQGLRRAEETQSQCNAVVSGCYHLHDRESESLLLTREMLADKYLTNFSYISTVRSCLMFLPMLLQKIYLALIGYKLHYPIGVISSKAN
jgi:hypothetical protein